MAKKKIKRTTCELCEFEQQSECKYCELSSEPNPEAYTRDELVQALTDSHLYRTMAKSPFQWQVGMRVKYIRSINYGPQMGSCGTIVELREKDIGKQGHEYQVFWVTPDDQEGTFWTIPTDVVWIKE